MKDSDYINPSKRMALTPRIERDFIDLLSSHINADNVMHELASSIDRYLHDGDEHEGKMAAFPLECDGARCSMWRAKLRYDRLA